MAYSTTRSGKQLKARNIKGRFRTRVIKEFMRIKTTAMLQKNELLMFNETQQQATKYKNANIPDLLKYAESVIVMCDNALANVEIIESHLNNEVPWKLRKQTRDRMLKNVLKQSQIKLQRLQLTNISNQVIK